MSEEFNPYYKWLGISLNEQPPNHYRLLGINLFESDLDVISSASDRQMSHLRSFQNGPRAKDCQRLLNEVANARVVLLDSNKKAAYDQTLRAASVPTAPIASPPTVPLTPAEIMPPAQEPAATTKASSPVVVKKPSKIRRKQSVGMVPLIAGGGIGLVVLLALFFGIRSASRPDSDPAKAKTKPTTDVAERSIAEAGKPTTTATKPSPAENSLSKPVEPAIDPSNPSVPTNALVDALDEYHCTTRSQPRLNVDGSFDATKSWRLSMRIDASSHAPGTVLCWGDSRAGKDPLCLKAGPDYISGWVMDNTRSDGAANLPRITVDWSSVLEIELIHDAAAQLVQMRVGEARQNVAVPHPPRPDRPMPVHLGGVGMGALHAYPCTIHDLRLEQLTAPFELPPPTVPMAPTKPEVVAANKPTEMPSEPEPTRGSLGDLVNPAVVSKLPEPDGSELRAALAQVRALFSRDFDMDLTPQESVVLAEKLIGQATQPGTATAIQFALLETAIEVATGAGAVEKAAEAITALDNAFEIDTVQRKARAAQAIAKAASEPWEHKAVVELLEIVIDDCVADDRYDLAMSLVEAAQDAARKAKDAATTTRIAARSKEVRAAKVKYEPILAALEKLSSESDDAMSHQTVGTHLCMAKGKWEEGLPHLVKGPASALRSVASKDVRNPSGAETQAAIGGAWQGVASELDQAFRLHALRRAEYWLRLAAEQASGLKRVPIESQIKEIGNQIGELAELPTGAVLVMTFEPSTLKKRGYVIDVSQHGHVGLVNGAVLTEGVAGNALGFDGKDDFVEIASTPWLSAPPAITLSAWVNIVSWKNPRDARDYVLSNEARGTLGYVLRFRDAGTADLTIGSRDWHPTLSSNKASLKQWHHIAATYDRTVSRVFLDGELESETSTPFSLSPSQQPFRIGQGAYRKDRGLFGRIDEVAIFNRALVPEEVRTVYRIGHAGRPLIK